MKERPIIFNDAMVRAILDERKTQTCRPVKLQPPSDMRGIEPATQWCKDDSWFIPFEQCDWWLEHPAPFVVGDTLWVRECWRPTGLFWDARPRDTKACGRFSYRADAKQQERDRLICWRPSIHMPRWASRINLTVTDLRVEKVQEISAGDAFREGCVAFGPDGEPDDLRPEFRNLWNSIYAAWKPKKINGEIVSYSCYPWDESDIQAKPENAPPGVEYFAYPNPWVWVVEFERINGEGS